MSIAIPYPVTSRLSAASVVLALLVHLVVACSGTRPTGPGPEIPSETRRFLPKTPLQRWWFVAKADAAMAAFNLGERFSRRELENRELPLRSPVTYPDLTVDRVMVAMRDGVKLRTHVFRPAAPGRFPVIMQRSPYDALSTLDLAPALYREFARRGYAVVAQDVRGRYGSEGTFEPLVNEVEDTYDAIDWASKQPWSTGQVGITGVSYQGAVAFYGGVGQHPALKAIMPVCMDYGTHASPSGGIPSLGSVASWLLFAGQDGSETTNPLRVDFEHLPLTRIDDEAGSPSERFDRYVSEDPTLQISLTAEEVEQDLARIQVPTLVTGGWHDVFLKGMLDNYQRQARHHAETTTLLVGPWHHNLATHDGLARIGMVTTPSAHLDTYWQTMEMFFDHHLKGEENPLSTAPGPVRIYLMGANEWRYEQQWPPERARARTLYLASDGSAARSTEAGRLGESSPAGEQAPDAYIYDPLNPVRTNEGMAVWEFVDAMGSRADTQRRDDVLVYTSDLLDEDVDVVGAPRATLYAASTVPDTDFIVTLSDVYPNGHVQYLTHGIVRVTYRDGTGTRTLIDPGKVYAYEIDLLPTSNRFQKGHRIRMDVTSSEMDRYARNQNLAEEPGRAAYVAIARQTIQHGGRYPSRLELPVIPNP
jgi:putative CocE/NonD family hydrolase